MTLYRAGDTVRPVRNITVENGKKRGRLFGGGSWTIYEDSYTVRQDSRADGRTVLADENGDTVAAVYADDLERVGAEGTVPEPAPETGEGDTPSAQSFPDVSGSAWYAGAVSALAAQGILNGYPDGTFRPDRPASRAEVAVLLTRVLELKGEDKIPDKQCLTYQVSVLFIFRFRKYRLFQPFCFIGFNISEYKYI